MVEIIGLAGTVTQRQGYRVITRSGGDEYRTTLRKIEDAEAEGKVVEPTMRAKIDGDTGEQEEIEATATEAVVEALEDRGVEVRE